MLNYQRVTRVTMAIKRCIVKRFHETRPLTNGGEKCGFLINHGLENLQSPRSPSFDAWREAKVSKVRGRPLSRHVTTKKLLSVFSFFFFFRRLVITCKRCSLRWGMGGVKPFFEGIRGIAVWMSPMKQIGMECWSTWSTIG